MARARSRRYPRAKRAAPPALPVQPRRENLTARLTKARKAGGEINPPVSGTKSTALSGATSMALNAL